MTSRLLAAGLLAASLQAVADGPDVVESITVTATRQLEKQASLAGPLNDTASAPAQITVIANDVLRTAGVKQQSDVMILDPSTAENYPAIGYYENFSIRGFTLSPASSYRIDGFVVHGEFDIPLENKDHVEILKGLGSSEPGVGSAGGLVNYVSKRPENSWMARVDALAGGGESLLLDYGKVTESGNAGVRVNLLDEFDHPYPDHADGHQRLASIALDVRYSPSVSLMADIEVQSRSQFAVPGFQLLGGNELPPNLPQTNINQQPWSRPVNNDGVFSAIRGAFSLSQTSTLVLGASVARSHIDDNLAFPFGCNEAPVQYFCKDGTYVLYDYHASEVRESWNENATLLAVLGSSIRHHVSVNVDTIARRVTQNDLYSNTLYGAEGRGLTGSIYNAAAPLPAPIPTPGDVPPATQTQVGASFADRFNWNGWDFQGSLRRIRLTQDPPSDSVNAWLPSASARTKLDPFSSAYVSAGSTMEFGTQAPITAENAGEILAPRRTNSVELGIRRSTGTDLGSVAMFRMSRPYEFTSPSGQSFAELGPYHRAGNEVHDGLELALGTTRFQDTQITGSAAIMSARANHTGETSFDGVQVQNIPRFRSVIDMHHLFAHEPRVEFSAQWFHTAARNARADGAAVVPSYDRIDVGLVLATSIFAGQKAAMALRITNLTNRTYWRDASQAYSADLLFPGSPREIWLSASLQQ